METPSKAEGAIVVYSLAVIALLVTFNLQDNDAFWHLANGRAMVEQKRIIGDEIFSYTAPGVKFSNHEWLSQTIFFLIFNAAGAAGLVFFKVSLTVLSSYLLYQTARFAGASSAASSLLTLTAVLAGAERYTGRPEMFSILFLCLLGFLLYGTRAGKVKSGWMFVIPLIMLLWDFLHGALYGLIFLSAFIAGESLRGFLSRRTGGLNDPFLKRSWHVFAVTAIVTLVNPYGLRSYEFFTKFLSDRNLMVTEISEWHPTPLDAYHVFWVLFFVTISVTVFFAFAKKADISQVFVLVPFSVMALKFTRATAVWALVSVPVLAYYLSFIDRWSKYRLKAFWRPALILLIALISVYVVRLKFFTEWSPFAFGYRADEQRLPIAAARFIKHAGLRGNMFNSGDIGGYLAYELYPERRIFLYNHHIVFEDIMQTVQNRKFLEDYSINYAVINRNIWFDLIFSMEEWTPVFWDTAATVLLRNNAENKSVIRKYGLRFYTPGIGRSGLRLIEDYPRGLPVLIREIARCLSFGRNDAMADYLGTLSEKPGSGIAGEEWRMLLKGALRHNAGSANLKKALKRFNG